MSEGPRLPQTLAEIMAEQRQKKAAQKTKTNLPASPQSSPEPTLVSSGHAPNFDEPVQFISKSDLEAAAPQPPAASEPAPTTTPEPNTLEAANNPPHPEPPAEDAIETTTFRQQAVIDFVNKLAQAMAGNEAATYETLPPGSKALFEAIANSHLDAQEAVATAERALRVAHETNLRLIHEMENLRANPPAPEEPEDEPEIEPVPTPASLPAEPSPVPATPEPTPQTPASLAQAEEPSEPADGLKKTAEFLSKGIGRARNILERRKIDGIPFARKVAIVSGLMINDGSEGLQRAKETLIISPDDPQAQLDISNARKWSKALGEYFTGNEDSYLVKCRELGLNELLAKSVLREAERLATDKQSVRSIIGGVITGLTQTGI